MRLTIMILIVAAAAALTACGTPQQARPARGAARIYSCYSRPCAHQQVFEIFDRNGSPIFSVGEFGGAGVFGDQLSVYPRNDVYHPVAQLRTNGTLMIGGQVITPRDISFIHCLEQNALGVCQERWRQ